MQIYWLSLKRVPELSRISSAERKKVYQACYSQRFVGSFHFFVALVVCGLCIGVGSMIGYYIHLVFCIPFSIWQAALGSGIGGGIGGGGFSEISIHYLRPFYGDYIKREKRQGVG